MHIFHSAQPDRTDHSTPNLAEVPPKYTAQTHHNLNFFITHHQSNYRLISLPTKAHLFIILHLQPHQQLIIHPTLRIWKLLKGERNERGGCKV